MAVRDDTTAQATQIGAVLFFGIRIISFATYQAFVVPNQNRSIEFSHNQALEGQLQELRNAIVSMSGGGTERAVSVSLGVTYPSHIVALNPGPASGSLRTAGTTNPLANTNELRYLDATTGTVTTVTDDTGSSVTATDTGVS
jgi:hypothetical protein